MTITLTNQIEFLATGTYSNASIASVDDKRVCVTYTRSGDLYGRVINMATQEVGSERIIDNTLTTGPESDVCKVAPNLMLVGYAFDDSAVSGDVGTFARSLQIDNLTITPGTRLDIDTTEEIRDISVTRLFNNKAVIGLIIDSVEVGVTWATMAFTANVVGATVTTPGNKYIIASGTSTDLTVRGLDTDKAIIYWQEGSNQVVGSLGITGDTVGAIDVDVLTTNSSGFTILAHRDVQIFNENLFVCHYLEGADSKAQVCQVTAGGGINPQNANNPGGGIGAKLPGQKTFFIDDGDTLLAWLARVDDTDSTSTQSQSGIGFDSITEIGNCVAGVFEADGNSYVANIAVTSSFYQGSGPFAGSQRLNSKTSDLNLIGVAPNGLDVNKNEVVIIGQEDGSPCSQASIIMYSEPPYTSFVDSDSGHGNEGVKSIKWT